MHERVVLLADVNAGVTHAHRLDGAWPAAPVAFAAELEPSLIAGLRIRIADFLPG